jgi:FixJ family two-component response regulator
MQAIATNRSVPLWSVEQVFGLSVATARKRVAHLTERERQVAMRVATGKPSREVAAELGISRKTIGIHRAHVRAKLHAYTAAQIANVVNLVRLGDVSSTLDSLSGLWPLDTMA